MGKRVDSASKHIRAPASAVYRAFAVPTAMETWLPPEGMRGKMLAFSFREGGSYRMRLTYETPHALPGKTSADADEIEVRFVRLQQDTRIDQAVTFDSEDPAFCGEMRMSWILQATGDGTQVTVRCEDVPVGIRLEDHQVGLASTLAHLAAFVEASRP